MTLYQYVPYRDAVPAYVAISIVQHNHRGWKISMSQHVLRRPVYEW